MINFFNPLATAIYTGKRLPTKTVALWRGLEHNVKKTVKAIEKLEQLFSPASVAVIDASDSFDKLGYYVVKSLVKGGYGGTIYPVNPKTERLWGIRAFSSMKDIPGDVDLAVIVVPLLRSRGRSRNSDKRW